MWFARIVELRSYGENALWDAMYFSDTAELETILELGANPNRKAIRDDGSHDYLMNFFVRQPVDQRTPSKLLLLLDYGADPNLPDSSGVSAYEINTMQLAWQDNDSPFMIIGNSSREMLRDAMKQAGAFDTEFVLILTKQWDTLRQRILDDPSLVHQKYYLGRTVLHLSAATADEGFIRFLAENGADINALDDFDMNPAMVSLIEKNPVQDPQTFPYPLPEFSDPTDWIPLLIELGTDIHHVGAQDFTLLHFLAAAAKSPTVLDALGPSVDLNPVNAISATPIHLAIQYRNTVSAAWLMDHGVRPSLESLAVYPNPDILKLLLSYGADPKFANMMVDLLGQLRILTPDMYEFNQETVEPVLESIQILLDFGVDPLDDTLFNHTPWQRAKDIQCAPCLELFSEVLIQRAAYLVSNAH